MNLESKNIDLPSWSVGILLINHIFTAVGSVNRWANIIMDFPASRHVFTKFLSLNPCNGCWDQGVAIEGHLDNLWSNIPIIKTWQVTSEIKSVIESYLLSPAPSLGTSRCHRIVPFCRFIMFSGF